MENVVFFCPFCSEKLREIQEKEFVGELPVIVCRYYCDLCKREIKPEDYNIILNDLKDEIKNLINQVDNKIDDTN